MQVVFSTSALEKGSRNMVEFPIWDTVLFLIMSSLPGSSSTTHLHA